MFRLSRYLRLNRSTPDTPEASQEQSVPEPAPAPQPVVPANPDASSRIQMITLRRGAAGDFEISYPPGEVPADSPSQRGAGFIFESVSEDEESASASAVAAVRLCVWAIFLFGFLFLFQRQQARFEQERSQQGTSRLRNPQLFHMNLPWVEFSGFTENGSNFVGHFIDSNASTLSVYRMRSGGTTISARRLGFSDSLDFDPSPIMQTENLAAIHSTGEENLVSLLKTPAGSFEFIDKDVHLSVPLPGDNPELVFFHYLTDARQIVTVSRSVASEAHCVSVFNISPNSTVCTSARSIYGSSGYFMDPITSSLVAVGVDDVSKDRAGYSLHGVYVQAYKVNSSKIVMDFSVTIPFLHRIDDGLWVVQNNPLTGGFILLMPTMGYPPTPVQHLVALREGTADFPKGTVFRMENESMQLFRKIESIRFSPNIDELDPTCTC